MSDEQEFETYEFEEEFDFGDRVKVDGYGERIFNVDGYSLIVSKYPGGEWTEVVYDLTAVDNGEWIEADQDDLTLAEPAINDSDGWPQPFKGGVRRMKEKPKAKPLTKREEIDNLLDIANWNRARYEATGDKAYQEAVQSIEARLRNLVAGGRGE